MLARVGGKAQRRKIKVSRQSYSTSEIHPEKLKWLESLLYAAKEVHLTKTGHEMPELHGMSQESFFSAAWK